MLCNLLDMCHCFRGSGHLNHQGRWWMNEWSVIHSDNGGIVFLWNVGTPLPEYMASYHASMAIFASTAMNTSSHTGVSVKKDLICIEMCWYKFVNCVFFPQRCHYIVLWWQVYIVTAVTFLVGKSMVLLKLNFLHILTLSGHFHASSVIEIKHSCTIERVIAFVIYTSYLSIIHWKLYGLMASQCYAVCSYMLKQLTLKPPQLHNLIMTLCFITKTIFMEWMWVNPSYYLRGLSLFPHR
jgi:hypothetical protein